MGDSIKWGYEQQELANEKAYEKLCKARLKKVDAVELDRCIQNLLDALKKQQLTKSTFNAIDDLRKVWTKEVEDDDE